VLYASGIALYMALPAEPPVAAALTPVVAAIALRIAWQRGAAAVPVTALILAISLGVAGAKLRTMWIAAPKLEKQLRHADVAGFVERVEPRTSRGPRVTLAVAQLAGLPPVLRPERIRVRFLSPAPGLTPGQPIRFRATLAPPARPALPGDFDFARMAYFQRIGAVGFVIGKPQPAPELGTPSLGLRLRAAIERTRHAIGTRIQAALQGETGAIANALMTGERGAISSATLDAYRDAGILHILSISGLHMAIMGGSVFFFMRLLLAAFPTLALRYPIKKWAAGAAALAAFGYLLISGSSYATVRAFIMILVMLFAIVLDRPAIALRNVAMAALAILIFVPESLYNAGFQMSFAAVVALVAAYEAWRDRRTTEEGHKPGMLRGLIYFMLGIVGSTVVAGIAVAPFAAYHFHQSQQLAVLANLIAIPICNTVVMPAALLSFVAMPFGLEATPLWLMGLGIDAMTWTAKAVASLPGAVARIPAFPAHAFALMVLGGLWLCLWRRRWRVLGIAAIAVGLALTPFTTRPDALIGRDGRLVAVRAADGRLAAMRGRSGTFELHRWLQHDGDGRTAWQARKSRAYRCDRAGCTVRVKSVLFAVAGHPRALADDCRRARVLVLSFPRPRGCRPEGQVIDFFALRRRGTHAVYIDADGAVRITSVAEVRGRRPWSLQPEWRRKRRHTRPNARVEQFASPQPLVPPDRDEWRPEIEGPDPFSWNQ
jgi:competence protein ComEC